MSLAGLERLLQHSQSFTQAVEAANSDTDFSAPEGMQAPLIAGLIRRRHDTGHSNTMLLIAATSREADAMRASLASLIPEAITEEFPAWETLPHEPLSPSAETVGRRALTLRLLREHPHPDRPLIIVASVRSALQPVSPHAAKATPITLSPGIPAKIGTHPEHTPDTPPPDTNTPGLEHVVQALIQRAYTRVDLVTRRGEFAVRGGILDVFAPTAEQAVRVEFFGNEIEQIRRFAVSDQRSTGDPLHHIELWPARELLLTEQVRHTAQTLVDHYPALAPQLEKMSQGVTVEGMESLIPQLFPQLHPITTLLPQGAAVMVLSPEKVTSRARNLQETNQEFLEAAWHAASLGAQAPIPFQTHGMLTLDELRHTPRSGPWFTLTNFITDHTSHSTPAKRTIHGTHPPQPTPGTDPTTFTITHLTRRLTSGWRVIITTPSAGLTARARDILTEKGIAARTVDELPEHEHTQVIHLVTGVAASGFESEEAKLALITETEFFGRTVSHPASTTQRQVRRLSKNVVDPLKLVTGDYVVHETHGIGRFAELTQRLVNVGTGRNTEKTMREYLVIEYASTRRGMPHDKLYVPTDQLDQLSRYVGGEAPSLSKMGGNDWANAKKKARKAVRDIAVELISLYSARVSSKGFAFSPDTPWQHELEEAFPHVETLDQLTTIDEVKRDMEKPTPMDRLVAGDVGFGKTEVAVRAAFKAIQDGKQVAMLVPTTLLVNQHIETFQNRFAGFPVRLRSLSRFDTEAEAANTRDGLAAGTVDMVIGTHRLLSDKVRYKDLGLLIIDEEQRFGVEHKDTLKKLKTNVDILAMSATPIPRTLEMAVTGIREMSTLTTPPENRHPILTFVGPRNDTQIGAAIRREMLREGQVFFVHNRVQSIGRVAAHIADLVPEARVAIAHGRLGEHQLERVVQDFWERKFDVLVTTTIIETGLDIANANTIMIDNADKYGLSQLHQLRGRVGRSRERAYAYFLYNPDTPFSEQAHERLDTLAKHNELGQGMQVALKDLELRGAGNLLGGEQSGHIAGVGFDLYLRMIGEAISTFRGTQQHTGHELVLELPVDASIPEEYIDSERLRLEAYQKFSAASHPDAPEQHVTLVLDELRDRYGEPPPEVERLAAVSTLRRRAARLGLTKLVASGGMLRVEPVKLPASRRMRMNRVYPDARYSDTQGVLQVPLPGTERSRSPVARLGRHENPCDSDIVEWVTRVCAVLLESETPPGSAQTGQASDETVCND